MIKSMVSVAVHAIKIKADLEDTLKKGTATWHAICLEDIGDAEVAFFALSQISHRTSLEERQLDSFGHDCHLKSTLDENAPGVSEPFCDNAMLGAMDIGNRGIVG